MPATVVIYDPEVSEAEYDYDTGTWVGGTVDAVYTGKARVQPIRGTSSVNQNANDTTVQSVLISIPIGIGKNLDLRPKHRARVTSAPLNPTVTKYVYVMQEVVDSSNPLERTFVFRVNQEQIEETT